MMSFVQRSGWVVVGLAAVVVCAAATAPSALSAQVVHGRVVDDTSGEPVSFARVIVMEGEEEAAGPLSTTREGRFEVQLPGPGTYRLRVERLGYPVHTSLEFSAQPFERIEVEVRIAPEAIPLAPLDVVARGPERGRDAFARRRELGQGVFVDPIHVALMRDAGRIRIAADVVRQVEGIGVSWRGQISTRLGWGCLVVFLDHSPIPVMHTGGPGGEMMSLVQPGRAPSASTPRLALGGEIGLNELVDYREVRAAEVYRSIDEVPDEIRRGIRWGDVGRCGVVWMWTTMGW